MFEKCSPESFGSVSAAMTQGDTLSEVRRDTRRGEFEKGRVLPARPEFASTIRGSLWRHRQAGLSAK